MSQKDQSTVAFLFLYGNTLTFCETPMPRPWTLPPYDDIFIFESIATPSHPCKLTQCLVKHSSQGSPYWYFIRTYVWSLYLCLIFQEEHWRFMERALNQKPPTKRCFCPQRIMSAMSSGRRWINTGWISPSVIPRTTAWFRCGNDQ